ncbi:MAG: hypothetical protein ABR915_02935 [Thermoguttaceae bacterium]
MVEAVSPNRRWLRPTPGWLPAVLLVVEGFLALSQRFHWFAFNERKGWTVLIALASVGVSLFLVLLRLVVALVSNFWSQFTIWSLLTLAIVVAVAGGWTAAEMKKAREQREVVVGITKLGGTVQYDHQFSNGTAPLLRTLFGDDFFDDAVEAVLNDDAQFERLKELTRLKVLLVHGPKVTDAGLRHLEEVTQIEALLLNGVKVTDAGLAQIKCLARLQRLILSSIPITDIGLRHLEGLTQLKLLWLNVPEVTDAELRHLEKLTQLEELRLNRTSVTDAGVKKLKQALPKCAIDYF